MNQKTRKIAWMGMLIALSFVGSYIKIPSPFQSIALDSMPAFLGALMLGGLEGAVIGFLGHMLTAANAGFYLSVPIHILVAFIMAVTLYAFYWTYKKSNLYAAGVVGILLNGMAAPLVLAAIPKFGWAFFVGITPFLLLASAVNIILGILLFVTLDRAGFKFRKGFDQSGR